MTLIKLFLYIGIVAILATALTIYAKKAKNGFISFLQYFCGILFLVSGAVKAVDPLGTAFKMEQYFSAFYFTFKDTSFAFVGNLFESMQSSSDVIAVVTIVLEMLLGVMLILGIKPRFTSWAFLILMLFFTKLTGFTFLTGYVPQDVNFFEFNKWGSFVASNMRVSDCGCFGDFLKIEPRTSFIKDLFLLIPAFIFIFKWKYFHRLLSTGARMGLFFVATAAFLLYNLNYTYWNEPDVDFRPFKEGINIRDQKQKEADADANRPVIMIIKSRTGGDSIVLSQDDYTKRFKEFPKDSFDIRSITGETTVPLSKLSDFIIMDARGNDRTGDILENKDNSLMVINYKVPYNYQTRMVEVTDTVWNQSDTSSMAPDTAMVKTVNNIVRTTKETQVAVFDSAWITQYKTKILPLLDKATENKLSVYLIMGTVSDEEAEQIRTLFGDKYEVWIADETLLKTVIRSNPGILLWHDGSIVKKWHINKAPAWKEIQTHLK